MTEMKTPKVKWRASVKFLMACGIAMFVVSGTVIPLGFVAGNEFLIGLGLALAIAGLAVAVAAYQQKSTDEDLAAMNEKLDRILQRSTEATPCASCSSTGSRRSRD